MRLAHPWQASSVENAQPELNEPRLNAFPSSLKADKRREGLRRFREREALRMSNGQAAKEFLARPGLNGLVNDNLFPENGAAQRVQAEQPGLMGEDENGHLNNPPVAPWALSPEPRGQRRRREPTEKDYLKPRVWRRRASHGPST